MKLITADGAEWIGDVAITPRENATLCLDPFHIVRVRYESPCIPGGG